MIKITGWFNVKDSELKEPIIIKIKKSLEKPIKDKDGKPVKYQEIELKTRCKSKFVYGAENTETEKNKATIRMDFYVRNRNSLKSLDEKAVIIFNGKTFNVKYVNVIGKAIEIRGEYNSENKY